MKKALWFITLSFLSSFSIGQISVSTFEAFDSIRIDDDLIFDNEGNLYGSNFNNGKVFRLKKDGSIEEFVSGIKNANGLAFDSSKNLFVVDHGGNKVYKVAQDGSKTVFLNGIQRPSGIIKFPDSDSLLLTRYVNNGIILRVAPNGSYDTLSMGGELNGPVGMIYDELGELYVGNFNDRKIIHVSKEGTQELLTSIPGTGLATSYLGFLAYADGIFYGTSFNANKVYQVRKQDTLISLLAGTTRGNLDGDTALAQFNQPNGVSLNSRGDTIFISDYGSGNIRVITGFRKNTALNKLTVKPQLMSLFPNPTKTSLSIKLQASNAFRAIIRISNIAGQIFLEEEVELIGGEQELRFELGELSRGNYFVECQMGEDRFFKQLIIE